MTRFLFLIAFLCCLFLIDLYVYQGFRLLNRGSSATMQHLGGGLFWFISLLSIGITFYFFYAFPVSARSLWMRFLFTAVFILFVSKLLWSLFLLADDLSRGLIWAGKQVLSADIQNGISRRSFLVKAGALTGVGFGAALTYGVTVGSHHYKIHRHILKIPKLPPGLQGMKILQISDIHSGSFWNRAAVERGISLVTQEQADLIFFTGDMVNNESSELEPYEELFKSVTAPLGVYAILGNHDYADYQPGLSDEEKKQDVQKLLSAYRRMGWNTLMDESVGLQHNGTPFNVIGVQNWSFNKRFPRYGNLEKAMQNVPSDQINFLLSHDPTHWKGEITKLYPQIDVTFSGHTHGMQFGIETARFKWSPVQYLYNEWAGFYREGGQQLYVNRGFGYLGYPGRLGIRPEIAVFELADA